MQRFPLSAVCAALMAWVIFPAGASPLKSRLEQLIVPKVDFKEATFDSTLDYLTQVAQKESGGRITPNFVRLYSPETAQKPITLSLTSMPYTEVLRYLGMLAGVEFVYEAHGILVKPPVRMQDNAPESR